MTFPARSTVLAALAALPALAGCLLFGGCTPTFDWREVRGAEAPYVILMPAKPNSSTRDIDLGAGPITMTMTVARAEDISFSITSGKLAQPSAADAALLAMKASLVRNTKAAIRNETASTTADGNKLLTLEGTFNIGPSPSAAKPGSAASALLSARFTSRNGYVYQIVAYGPEKALSGQVLDTFLTSFRPEGG
jgi:hypothetical protein